MALLVSALGVAAVLFLGLWPSPTSSSAGGVAGWTFGTLTEVTLPSSCEVVTKRGMDASDMATCDGATWSVDGTQASGPLRGQVRHIVMDGFVAGRVDARVFNGAAYTKPPAMAYGMVTAALVLLVISLLTAAMAYLRAASARSRESSLDESRLLEARALAQQHGLGNVVAVHRAGDYGMSGLMALGKLLLAVAAVPGAIAVSIMADGTFDRYGGAAAAVAVLGLIAYGGYRRRQDQPEVEENAFAAVCDEGLLVSRSRGLFVCRWPDATLLGERDGITETGGGKPFSIRRADGRAETFNDETWSDYHHLRAQAFDRVQAAVKE